MKVAIIGSRGFPRPNLVRGLVRRLPSDTIVVSGACPNSPDEWAADEARLTWLKVIEYPAEWDKHGKRAGFLRDIKIIQEADRVVAFWDGVSKGTKHGIDEARRLGKPLMIVSPNGTRSIE